MASKLDRERKKIEEDEAKLRDRKRALIEAYRAEVMDKIQKLTARLDTETLSEIFDRIQALGPIETLRRLGVEDAERSGGEQKADSRNGAGSRVAPALAGAEA